MKPGKQPPFFSRTWHRTSMRGTAARAMLPHNQQISIGTFPLPNLQYRPSLPLRIRVPNRPLQHSHRNHVRTQHQHHPQVLPIHKPRHDLRHILLQHSIKHRLNRHHHLRRPRLSPRPDGHHNRHSPTPQDQSPSPDERRSLDPARRSRLNSQHRCKLTRPRASTEL